MRAAILGVVAACAAPTLPSVRFANQPPVTAINDRLDVPHKPEGRLFLENLYHYDAVFQRRLTRALELHPDRRALGVNALDEVPDSTWFTNRIGVRDYAPEELARGPNTVDSPELHKPWTVHATKSGKSDLGFLITDTRGLRFMIKFDAVGYPEQETATHLIVDRILWACGFNVTEDFLVHLRREDLVVAPDAKFSDGAHTPLRAADLDERLAPVDRAPGGGYRALASRWLEGQPLGGHPSEGVREDDVNDRIPHELRRELRGAGAIFAWLDHVDIQESNFVDTWVADPEDPERHYVKHYAIDFGKSLGVMATIGHDPRRGHAYVIDLADMARSLVEVGLVERSWEPRRVPPLRGVGLFDAATYDPGTWKNDYPVYVPLLVADRFDQLWGAKLAMRFTRAQLRAIVGVGEYSDPRAADYVLETLIARQRQTGAYWFARVNPLDRFAAAGDQLCFDDLAVAYQIAPAATTRYRATVYDRAARVLATPAVAPAAAGHACVPVALAAGGDGYTMVRLETARPGFTGATIVHLARDPAGAPRVIGIWRE